MCTTFVGHVCGAKYNDLRKSAYLNTCVVDNSTEKRWTSYLHKSRSRAHVLHVWFSLDWQCEAGSCTLSRWDVKCVFEVYLLCVFGLQCLSQSVQLLWWVEGPLFPNVHHNTVVCSYNDRTSSSLVPPLCRDPRAAPWSPQRFLLCLDERPQYRLTSDHRALFDQSWTPSEEQPDVMRSYTSRWADNHGGQRKA